MIRYDKAGTKCSGKPQPGAVALQAMVLARYPGTKSAGIYNCRPVRGGASLSLHGEGRAVDIRPVDKAQGDKIAAWLLANADSLNVQEIIWYRRIWTARYPSAGWRDYNGVNAHTDHVHVGLNWDGAKGAPPSEMQQVVESGSGGLLGLMLVSAALYGLYQLLFR